MIQKTLNEIQPSLLDQIKSIAQEASKLPFEEKVTFLNEARLILHEISPFVFEPIDYVKWVPASKLKANDWNPNKMAQNEVNMLDFSMIKYGMAQAIVGWETEDEEDRIIDGWHRNWRCDTNSILKNRMHEYLPVVYMEGNEADQIEATDLFNKIKGKHGATEEAKLVQRLVDNGRDYEEISKNLGKSCEEIIRLQQAVVAPILANKHYARAWVVTDGNETNSISGDTGKLSDESGEGKNIISE